MDDLITSLENETNSTSKEIYTAIFVRSLPIFAYSLHEKMFHDFKKLLGRAKKHCYKDIMFNFIY